jgi:hypothetical protein
MRIQDIDSLKGKKLITEGQHSFLTSVYSKQIVSVHHELRFLLYIGVLLLTGGLGVLIYKNIGELGHVISIILLSLLTVVCFAFAFMKAVPFSKQKTQVSILYYDYVVLMGCLLFISVIGYIQYQYGWFNENMELTTLITAVVFLVTAYRFDHLGVLSLGITALASFFGLTVSPQKWYSSNFFDDSNLHITAMVFGAALATVAIVLERYDLKKHFTFTYINFSSLLYLTGAVASIFINAESYELYLLLLLAGCAWAVYYANKSKSFLFLLYAFVFGYIGITYFISDYLLDNSDYLFFWYYYLVISCGGFIFFIIRFKNYFKRES